MNDTTDRTNYDKAHQFKELPEIEENGAMYFGNAVFYPDRERVATFIDGQNLYATIRQLTKLQAEDENGQPRTMNIDYKRLLRLLTRLGISVQTSYYTPVFNDDGFETIRPLIDWLDYNGYNVVTKMAKVYETAEDRPVKVKDKMDCDIVVDVMSAVYSENVEHVILFSGDGDFRSMVAACQRKNVRVTVVSSMMTRPTVLIADELRRQASQFLDLYSIFPLIQSQSSNASSGMDSRVEFRQKGKLG